MYPVCWTTELIISIGFCAFPFKVFSTIILFASLLASIIIIGPFAAQSDLLSPLVKYGVLTKIATAYVAFELLCFVYGFVSVLFWRLIVIRFFFFCIDVVPAHGGNVEEAKAIAIFGRAFELNKKYENEIENWTYDNTAEFVKASSVISGSAAA